MKRLLILVAVVASTLTLSGCEDEFKNMCVDDLGGKVTEDTKYNSYNGIDSKTGSMVNGTITETTKFCVVDGKVVAQS